MKFLYCNLPVVLLWLTHLLFPSFLQNYIFYITPVFFLCLGFKTLSNLLNLIVLSPADFNCRKIVCVRRILTLPFVICYDVVSAPMKVSAASPNRDVPARHTAGVRQTTQIMRHTGRHAVRDGVSRDGDTGAGRDVVPRRSAAERGVGGVPAVASERSLHAEDPATDASARRRLLVSRHQQRRPGRHQRYAQRHQ